MSLISLPILCEIVDYATTDYCNARAGSETRLHADVSEANLFTRCYLLNYSKPRLGTQLRNSCYVFVTRPKNSITCKGEIIEQTLVDFTTMTRSSKLE